MIFPLLHARRLWTAWTFLLALALWCLPASALDPSRALTQYAQRIWQTQQGLPQATLYAVHQTQSGYLWLGTLTGLVRFDGVRFTRVEKVGGINIGDVPVRDLAEDHTGTLWLATDGAGVIGLRDDGAGAAVQISTAQGLPSAQAAHLLVDSHNALWIASAGGLSRWADSKLTSWTTADGLATNNLAALCQTPDGRIWAAGKSTLLSAGDKTRFTTVTLNTLPPGATIQALAAAPDGTVWAGTTAGLVAREADGNERRYRPADGLADDDVCALTMGAHNTLWAGTHDGFSRIHAGEMDSFHDRDGLSQSTVYAIGEDKEGSLWVATKHGLNQFLDGRTVPVTTREGLASNDTSPVLQDQDGTVWVGTLDAGLSRFDGHKFTTLTTADGLPSNRILALAQGQPPTPSPTTPKPSPTTTDLWIGTDHGVARWQKDRITARYSIPEGLTSPIVHCLLVDRSARVWAGTDVGLLYLAHGRFAATGIHTPVTALLQRADGTLAAATDNGVTFLNPQQPTQSSPRLDVGRTVDALYEDPDGALWMGTLGGGLCLAPHPAGKIVSFSLRDGLFDDDIFAILADDQGRLWMACGKGVFSVTRDNLLQFAAGAIPKLTCTPFSPTDALRTIECKSGVEPAGCTMADGRLWFSTTRGIVILDPARLPRRLASPPVVVEEVAVDGRTQDPAAIAALPAGRKNLMFRYTGISFIAPGRLTFRYQLQGFDRTWVDAGARREAFYTNLPPGHYAFRVQAANVDGLWTDSDIQQAAVAFALAPAWWQHPWFLPLCLLAAVLFAGLAFHLRVRTLRHRMALVVAERSRIARELHDTLLQGFAGVTMEMQALSVRLPASGERRTLEDIIRDAALCLKEARRSVAGLRERNGSVGGLAAILENAAREMTAGKPVQLSLDTRRARAGALELSANIEYNLMRIAREAIANALRHADAATIAVVLAAGPDQVTLEVTDNGAGFSPPEIQQNGHFGLLGMRERAHEIGAEFELLSHPGKGTLISVRLRLGAKKETEESRLPKTGASRKTPITAD